MHDFLASTRRCATCQWWEGERIADRAGGRVHTPHDATAGRCRSRASWWSLRLKQGDSTCSFWEPWETLQGLLSGRARDGLIMLGPPMRAASHALLIEPVNFRFNRETEATNAFQTPPLPEEEPALSVLAVEQHHQLRDLLVGHGVTITLAKSLATSPDAPFCNNWFSTHPADDRAPATLVLYPLMAENRRIERRGDLVTLLRPAYTRVVDLSLNEKKARFLESTGSLVLDHQARVAYASLSPRTDLPLAKEWAEALAYDLVVFTATDRRGIPFYHTNVLMFVGHGLAGVCLESIAAPGERKAVEDRLRKDGRVILPLSQEQAANFCGNCLALSAGDGSPLFVMSSLAYRHFSPSDRATLEGHGKILHTELSAFEKLGGGSARCLIAELF